MFSLFSFVSVCARRKRVRSKQISDHTQSESVVFVLQKCSDPVVSDKSRFPTFARTQPSSSLSGSSVVRLMLYYGWRKFSIVVELNDLMIRAGQKLKILAKQFNMTINDFVNITSPYSSLYDSHEIRQLVLNTYLRTRGSLVLKVW